MSQQDIDRALKKGQSFEVSPHMLKVKINPGKKYRQQAPGELVIDTLGNVEDSYSLTRRQGRLSISNIRLIWVSKSGKWMISIGFDSIMKLSVMAVPNKNVRTIRSLKISCEYKYEVFEFMFSHKEALMERLFSTANAVFRSFVGASRYRTLFLHGSIFRGDMLDVLMDENILETIEGIMRYDRKGGIQGTLVITTHRLAWHSDVSQTKSSTSLFSMPYICITGLAMKGTKAGACLIIQSEGVKYAFRKDSDSTTMTIARRIFGLLDQTQKNPDYGVRVKFEGLDETSRSAAIKTITLQPDVLEQNEDDLLDGGPNPLSCYQLYSAKPQEARTLPVLIDGLAFEGNNNIEDIWRIV